MPCAEGAQDESNKSCLDARPPLAGISPASGEPGFTHRPQHSEQVTWREFYNLAADGFTIFSKAFVFLKIKGKGVIQCLEMTQRAAKAALFPQTEQCVNPYLERSPLENRGGASLSQRKPVFLLLQPKKVPSDGKRGVGLWWIGLSKPWLCASPQNQGSGKKAELLKWRREKNAYGKKYCYFYYQAPAKG